MRYQMYIWGKDYSLYTLNIYQWFLRSGCSDGPELVVKLCESIFLLGWEECGWCLKEIVGGIIKGWHKIEVVNQWKGVVVNISFGWWLKYFKENITLTENIVKRW